jgi:EAL domain-containing protein (putative c-di-GMP-specific phosphodiesterase class I)
MLAEQTPTLAQKWFSGRDPLGEIVRPGGLSVVFQPIVDLRPRGRLLHSLECLARGPAGTPFEDASALFDYVRTRGAEVEVDRICAANAIRAAANLPSGPLFSVNVHASTLAADPKFAGHVVELLCHAGLPPARLIVDVLARRSFDGRTFDSIERLRAVGVRIAVDDVGLHSTDYQALVDCHPDFLKIDRAVVRRSPPDDLRDLMLESIARLARSMGAEAVAEGVETLEELDAAASHGVSLVQGHFFGEAMSARSIARSGLLQAA